MNETRISIKVTEDPVLPLLTIRGVDMKGAIAVASSPENVRHQNLVSDTVTWLFI